MSLFDGKRVAGRIVATQEIAVEVVELGGRAIDLEQPKIAVDRIAAEGAATLNRATYASTVRSNRSKEFNSPRRTTEPVRSAIR